MNLAELKQQFRVLADDNALGHQCPDTQLIYWLNEAEREACVRARLLFETDNPEICRVYLIQGQKHFPLHPAVLEIEQLWFRDAGGNTSPVQLVSRQYLDRTRPHWRTDSSSPPRFAVQGDTTISPIGHYQTGDWLFLECTRWPLREMQQDYHKPEIHAAHHPLLIDWALYRYYSVADTETLNPTRGMEALSRFTRHFGQAPTAQLLRDTRHDVPQLNISMP